MVSLGRIRHLCKIQVRSEVITLLRRPVIEWVCSRVQNWMGVHTASAEYLAHDELVGLTVPIIIDVGQRVWQEHLAVTGGDVGKEDMEGSGVPRAIERSRVEDV